MAWNVKRSELIKTADLSKLRTLSMIRILQRDFCENQLEIITGVNDSVKNAIEELAEWDLTARKKLAESGEKLLSIQILHIFQTHRKSLLPIPIWKYQNSIIANNLNRSTANP